jgi:uncharacterized integral membrane protein
VTNHAFSRLSLVVTKRLAVVVAALACYEALLFAVIAPRVIGDIALPIIVVLAAEIVPIALISAVVWDGRIMPMRRRILVFAVATVLCILGTAAVSPVVFRGAAEQIGWLATPPRHFSGVHELPLSRHLSYVILAAIAGLLFARDENNQKTSLTAEDEL